MQARLALTALLLTAATALTACCGGVADSPQTRRAFMDRFNTNPDLKDCRIDATDPDLVQLTLTCQALTLNDIDARVRPVCSSFEPFGFQSMKAVGSDGETTIALDRGCTRAAPTSDARL